MKSAPSTHAPTEASPALPAGEAAGKLSRLRDTLHLVRAWAADNWIRSTGIGAGIVALLVATVAAWTYLASLAIDEVVLLDDALAAWKAGDVQTASTIVAALRKRNSFQREDLGGMLFLIGALKCRDAQEQWSADQRRATYLVASRYLEEARERGFPEGLEAAGWHLLGQSQLASNRFADAVATLQEALAIESIDLVSIHRFLAEAHARAESPRWDQALVHSEAVLAAPSLSTAERAEALMRHAQILGSLRRFEEARQAIASMPSAEGLGPRKLILEARILLDETAAASELVRAGDPEMAQRIAAAAAQAIALLQQAQALDPLGGEATRQAMVLIGQAHRLQGNTAAAIDQFAETRRVFNGTTEGLAAMLAEAELLDLRGERKEALLAYHRVLESVDDPSKYGSELIPLAHLRDGISAAVSRYVERDEFENALWLLEAYTPLFDRPTQIEDSAATLAKWGEELQAAAPANAETAKAVQSAARRRMRQAGVAYERLAELRFATPSYTESLWLSAENYFQGQSFTSAARVLQEYLRNEAERKNPQVLLRLGQAYLALGQLEDCISALEECIEFHPRDVATYQARIDCAQAYQQLDNAARAEQLLQENLTGTAQTPRSPQWRDSLFEMGMLLHHQDRHAEAIQKLEEAVARYPESPRVLVAQYLIGDSYRRAADVVQQRVLNAKTSAERDKSWQIVEDYLNESLNYYELVQREITLASDDRRKDVAKRAMLRNCYMLQGSVLFDLQQYDDAIKSYSNLSSLYQDEPFVLETFVQMSHCWRRLGRPEKARGSLQQALIVLDRIPEEADFLATTNFSRAEWQSFLATLSQQQ